MLPIPTQLEQRKMLPKIVVPAKESETFSNPPKPHLYRAIFLVWGTCWLWFHPRLIQLLYMADSPLEWSFLLFFILFIEFAWLYGVYNLSLIGFAFWYRFRHSKKEMKLPTLPMNQAPKAAILYTTCNDFVVESAQSCVQQDYPDYTVYILDDSTQEADKNMIDAFAAQHPDRVQVIRRPDRKGFKAGNMNHGLSHYACEEPYFAIADADEILPPDFLSKLVPIMESDPTCGFVQANHRANPDAESALAQSQGVGIDLHWKWYQPLRNRYGFVMFLGHGALLRRSCWEEIGGFPDIVSEDLGFAIRIREKGYRGRFVEEVICYEDFPDSVRSFRIRHMKWTRGTCEFLHKEAVGLIKSTNISWAEKLDILFPTMNLPLTLLYFVFMVIANLGLPVLFGHAQPLTIETSAGDFVLPIIALDKGFEVIFTPDFYIMTMLTFFAPVVCFIVGLAHKPLKLFKFLSHSTALYAALGPLSAIGVVGYLFTGKAVFLVTGDKKQASTALQATRNRISFGNQLKQHFREIVGRTHPDYYSIQAYELIIGIGFAILCFYLFQISFFGLCLAFILLPIMHYLGWENKLIRVLVYLPFLLIILGVTLGGMSAFGLATVFFGYGFHF
ncbi:MAG: glycosyltransferase family 2 protein [Bacteroidia bacterium]